MFTCSYKKSCTQSTCKACPRFEYCRYCKNGTSCAQVYTEERCAMHAFYEFLDLIILFGKPDGKHSFTLSIDLPDGHLEATADVKSGDIDATYGDSSSLVCPNVEISDTVYRTLKKVTLEILRTKQYNVEYSPYVREQLSSRITKKMIKKRFFTAKDSIAMYAVAQLPITGTLMLSSTSYDSFTILAPKYTEGLYVSKPLLSILDNDDIIHVLSGNRYAEVI